MSDDTSSDLDSMKEQFGGGGSSRIRSASQQENTEATDADPVVSAIVKQRAAISNGEVTKKLSVNDDVLAAGIRGYEAAGELDALYETLADHLDRPDHARADDVDRSEVLRLLLRVGLQDGAPEAYEDLLDAEQAYNQVI